MSYDLLSRLLPTTNDLIVSPRRVGSRPLTAMDSDGCHPLLYHPLGTHIHTDDIGAKVSFLFEIIDAESEAKKINKLYFHSSNGSSAKTSDRILLKYLMRVPICHCLGCPGSLEEREVGVSESPTSIIINLGNQLNSLSKLTSTFPQSWIVTRESPIHKSGYSWSHIGEHNYRSFAVLSLCPKVFDTKICQ